MPTRKLASATLSGDSAFWAASRHAAEQLKVAAEQLRQSLTATLRVSRRKRSTSSCTGSEAFRSRPAAPADRA